MYCTLTKILYPLIVTCSDFINLKYDHKPHLRYPLIHLQRHAFSIPVLGSVFFPHWLISLGGIPLIGLGITHSIVNHAGVGKLVGAIVSMQASNQFSALCAYIYIHHLYHNACHRHSRWGDRVTIKRNVQKLQHQIEGCVQLLFS